jgi:polyhydroxybutyrate depolymerase
MPKNYSKAISLPLIILLPGYHKENTYLAENLFKNKNSQENYIVVTANATKDRLGNYFWNSKAACCNFFQSRVDDKKYLNELTKYLLAEYKVDRGRVYMLGHSNGGFMALNMACQENSPYAGIVSFAGAGNLELKPCHNNTKNSLLLIHGTSDSVISYNGGDIQGSKYASAQQTTQQWLKLKDCENSPKISNSDFIDSIPGDETTKNAYRCGNTATVNLWSIEQGSHTPQLNGIFTKNILDFFSRD